MKLSTTILLVEDDIEDQEFFIAALKGVNNVILSYVANNGKEALNMLNNTSSLPDVIFTDINMPVMNGIEFLNGITKSPHTKDIPVVILSSDTGKTEFFFRLGATAIIEKVPVLDILREKIEKIITP